MASETGRAPTVRNICFTINADERGGGKPLLLLDMEHETWAHVKYCVYQRELGGNTHHEHFQGYMELSASRTFEQIHSMEGMERARFAP